MAVIKIVPMPGAVGDKGDEGAPGAQGPQGPAGQNGLPGTPALWSYQGTWNSAAAYAVGDVVVYQGQLYYTKSVTTAGTLPTVTAKFDLIASKGADGTNGTNGTNGADALWNFLGEYNGGADYNIGDVVTYNGGTYYRILPLNAGYAPGTEYWTTIASPGADAVLPTGATGTFQTSDSKIVTVANGIITSIESLT
jgi:collagen type VII alpha